MVKFIEACFFRDVLENDWSAVDKSSCCYGTGLSVFLCSVRHAGRNTHASTLVLRAI
jgi:hypothetical protein